jgi:hypothetical protein
VRLEEIESSIIDNQLMIHILNNITPDYDLHIALTEKCIGEKTTHLTVEEIKSALVDLRFERLTVKPESKNVI